MSPTTNDKFWKTEIYGFCNLLNTIKQHEFFLTIRLRTQMVEHVLYLNPKTKTFTQKLGEILPLLKITYKALANIPISIQQVLVLPCPLCLIM